MNNIQRAARGLPEEPEPLVKVRRISGSGDEHGQEVELPKSEAEAAIASGTAELVVEPEPVDAA